MRMIDAKEVHRLLDYPSLIEALNRAHLSDAPRSDAALLQDGDHSFLALPAWRPGGALGAKLVAVFPENAEAGKPAVQAAFIMFDGADGTPVAVIDGTALTYRKTAADSGLGARHLAREDARTLLMVGAGGLAPHVIEAHRAARPSIETVFIWNRSPEKAAALAERLGVDAVHDLERAARSADVISCATNSVEPLIHGEWLKPGAHLDLIGSYTPDMRETDPDAFRRGGFWCDGRERALADSGEVADAIRYGALSAATIRGDLHDLARGTSAGRGSPSDITIFKNAGGGHLDLMCAEFLLSRAGATS